VSEDHLNIYQYIYLVSKTEKGSAEEQSITGSGLPQKSVPESTRG